MKKLISVLFVLILFLRVPAAACAEGSIYDLLDKCELCYEADLEEYYLGEMLTAAKEGRVKAGQTACANRNEIIERNASATQKIDFDELYLLAKLINAEAGSDWLTDDFRFCFGEVVMNRVASPEFPDSLSGVILQKGQYASTGTSAFAYMVPPENCIDIALRLLQGERKMAESVVFCSSYIQGEIFSVYEDWRLGITYFCVSNNLDLYPID